MNPSSPTYPAACRRADGGRVCVGGNVAGRIQINGALRNATLEEDPLAGSAEITVGSNLASTGSIVVAKSVERPVTVTGAC
jgi:hypothetical protein